MKKMYNNERKTQALVTVLLTGLFFLITQTVFAQATVTTDKADYLPGETVTITGSGWQAGETVELLIQHLYFVDHPDELLLAEADENGNILNTEYVIHPEDLGEIFILTATGQSSGLEAYAEFTDGDFLGTIEIGDPVGYFLPGIEDSIKFPVIVTRAGPANGNFDVRVCIEAELPHYFTYRFDIGGYHPDQGIIPVATGQDTAFGTLTVYYDGYESVNEDEVATFSMFGYVLPNNNNENYNCNNPTLDTAVSTFSGVLQFGYEPTIVCPTDISLPTETGICEASPTWDLTYVFDDMATLLSGEYNGYPQPMIEYSTDGNTFIEGSGSGMPFTKGVHTVHLAATNDIGGDTCSFTVTVLDQEAPTFTAPSEATIYKDETCGYVATVDITGDVSDEWDNCDEGLEAVFTDVVVEGDCEGEQIITRTWSLTDLSGNSSSQTQTINVLDTTSPTFTVPDDTTIYKDESCNYYAGTDKTGDVTDEADNCDTSLEATHTDAVSAGSCEGEQIITRTWSLTDDCGNNTTQIQVITAKDTTSPTFTVPNDTTIYKDENCNYDASISKIGDVTDEADNCDTSLDASHSDIVSTGSCDGEEIITRTWSLTDDCGNNTTQIQIITAKDTTSPTFTVPDDETVYKDENCDYDASPGITGDVTDEADNCDTNLDATHSNVVSAGLCEGEEIITRTWTLTDDCGNTTTQIQIITVEDNTAPTFTVPGDITISKDIDCNHNDAPSNTGQVLDAADNCDPAPEVSYSDSDAPGACTGEVIITRTWTVTDYCDNSTSKVQTITVADDMVPDAVCQPATIVLDENGETTLNPGDIDGGSSDNCTPVGELILTADPAEFDCSDAGIDTVVLTVTDACGNTATCEAEVKVVIPTTTEAYTSAEATRYLDEVTLYAVVYAVENCNEENPVEGNVIFRIDGDSVGTAPAYPIPPDEPGSPDSLRAALVLQITKEVWDNLDPTSDNLHRVEAEFVPTSDFHNGSSDETDLYIFPREATFVGDAGFYTGEVIAWTTGPNSSTGTITLAATVVDTSSPTGDVRGATVTFFIQNGDSWNPIPGASNLPVGLIDQTDGTVGIASADLQLNIGKQENATQATVGVVIGGGYFSDKPVANTAVVVTVAKPELGGSILGGGSILLENALDYASTNNVESAGLIKGADREFTSFSFDVSYNKKMTNPQGKMTILVRSWYDENGILHGEAKPRTYQIKTNAINLLAIGPQETRDGVFLKDNQAIFEAKANLSQWLDDETLVTVEGNSPLRVTLTDDPEGDSISITYFRSEGGLWFSNSWSMEDNVSLEQILTDGEIFVSTTASGSTADAKGGGKEKSAIISDNKTLNYNELKVYPVPFMESVNFEFVAKESGVAKIDIYDMTGRKVQTIFDQIVEKQTLYNARFKPEAAVSGMYFYHMQLGNENFRGKLIYKKE